jgi:cytochrome c553
LRALAGVLLAALIVAVVSGCGTGGPAEGGDANQGKKLFIGEGKCGGCHELKDAASRGQIGPNLDEAFQQDKAEGYEESGIQNVVLDQIRFPREGSVMPADLVEGDDAVNVAAYVAKCAAADPENEQDRLACPGIVAKPWAAWAATRSTALPRAARPSRESSTRWFRSRTGRA